MNRVVVTGIGMVTPLAYKTKDTWKRLIEGKSGVNKIVSFDKESDWIAKCWELKLENGNSLESLISMPGIICYINHSFCSIGPIKF